MKLEDQVVSLELAKKLKALNVKQESLFWWVGNHFEDKTSGEQFTLVYGKTYPYRNCYSAFTVAELGEMLPKYCPQHEHKGLSICRGFGEHDWMVGYGDHQNSEGCHVEIEATEANARAETRIYLLENKLIGGGEI